MSDQIESITIEEVAQRKQDALALAQLLYDIYQDNQGNDKVLSGQNNANEIEDD